MKVLDAETLADVAKFPSIDKVYCSPYQPIELFSTKLEGPVELRDGRETHREDSARDVCDH